MDNPGQSFAYSEAMGRPRFIQPSESGLGKDDDDNASIAFSDAMSERPSKPRSTAPSQRAPSISGSVKAAPAGVGGGSRLASEANFGDDDDGNASIAYSDAVSERPSKARSAATSQRAPSVSGSASISGSVKAAPGPGPPSIGGGSRKASEADFDFGGDDDGNASIAFSDAMSERPSKPRSAAPSQRAPSVSGSVKASPPPAASVGGSSRKVSDFGGTSIAGDEDGNASIAFSEAMSERPSKARSAAPSQRAPSISGGGGSSRKPSEAGSARPSGMSGMSYDVDHDDDGAASTSTPPPKRPASASKKPRESASSGVSSLRASAASVRPTAPGTAASVAGNSLELDGDVEADVSLSYSQLGDDAVSTRSGATAAKRRSSATGGSGGTPPPAAPSVSGLSMASSRSAATARTSPPAAAAKPAAKSAAAAKASSSFQEEGVPSDDEVSDLGVSEDEEGAPKRVSMSMSGRVSLAAASHNGSTSSSRPAPARASSSGGGAATAPSERPTSAASSRRSAALAAAAATTATASSVGGGYSDDFDAKSSSRGGGGGGESAAGSIFQAGGDSTPATARSGASVFRRMPANAPDSPPPVTPPPAPAATGGRPPTHSGGSARSSSRTDPRGSGGGAAGGGEWNEGAIRVPPPGAPRPYSARKGADGDGDGLDGGGSSTAGAAAGMYGRPRPMSAAPRDRQGAAAQALTRKHPATWDTMDVALWIEFLGLGQYRRRFLHHCVDGRLLLRIRDAQLKAELGIGPMGHRMAILEAAADVVAQYEAAQADREGGGGGDDEEEGGRHEYGGRSGSAPRHRPASAMPGGGGALTAPPPPPHGPRRPASASRSVIPPDSHLGPAQGKVTVYEQRAKLLFELDRAQARAEQHRSLAAQLEYTATLSHDEVAHLRGLLLDIEKKNRAAFGGASGGVDSSARIPWRHVGSGTKHNNWNSERFARPGEPETVDLTFQPQISKESKKIMGGGGEYAADSSGANNFLDRLNNDLRKRETNKKELERRYFSEGSGDVAAGGMSDLQVVTDALQNRCHVTMDEDPAVYEEQIDEAIDKLSTNENWREAGCKAAPIRAAKGSAKVAAAAAALRSLAFMERYRSDLRAKDGRLKALEKKWLNQTLGAQYLPGAKDKEDLEQAVSFFALLGWRGDDGAPAEEAVTEDLLDRLLDRALEYRVRFDAWWERVREKPEERSAGFRCDVDWRGEPRWAADGLGPRMEAEMGRGSSASVDMSPGGMDFVEFTVRLLGKSRPDDLRRMRAGGEGGLDERPKRLAVYRAIRTQKFIEFTQKDLEERDRKLRQAYTALAPAKRVLQSTRIEGFFERLMEDASKRRAKAEKLAHDKVAKEKEILASSVMYGRPRSAR